MRIIFFGDIVGKIGRKAVFEILPKLKKEFKPELILANGENLAHGKGVTMKIFEELTRQGINLLTSGNHIWNQKEIYEIFEKDLPILRPANWPLAPGKGYEVIKVGNFPVLVVNLMGRVFFREVLDCPFREIDKILKNFADLKTVIIDFHAEATSEKIAFGFYVDGRVSAVLGTHTHIPTSDAKILPQGTAYLTEVGMVGAKDSVIGVKKEPIIKSFLTQLPWQIEIPEHGEVVINAVFLEINPKTGKATKIERIEEEIYA